MEKIDKEVLEAYNVWISYEDMAAENNPNFSTGPIIGWCPEYNTLKNPETNEPLLNPTTKKPIKGYRKTVYNLYKDLIEEKGGHLFTLKFEDRPSGFLSILDGLLIPGGSDIDPKKYGEENNGSVVKEEVAEPRWNHVEDWINNTPSDFPIFALCYGYELIWCLNGGKLIQHLDNADEHLFVPRKMRIVPNTKLHEALQLDYVIMGCNHHQNVKEPLPENVVVNCYDDEDGTIHGFELKDRNIYTILPHPEIPRTFVDGVEEEICRRIFHYLVKLGGEYKVKKSC